MPTSASADSATHPGSFSVHHWRHAAIAANRGAEVNDPSYSNSQSVASTIARIGTILESAPVMLHEQRRRLEVSRLDWG